GSPDVGPLVPVALARRLDGRSFGVREVVCERLPVFLQTALIRRAAFDAAGGIDVTLARHADLELTCRLALTGRTVFLDVPVFLYRLHGTNQTRDRLPPPEGLGAVRRPLRGRHPQGATPPRGRRVRGRERRHLYRIAWRHWMAAWLHAHPGELVVAGAAVRQALALHRRPTHG